MVRVSGWGLYYIYESPLKERSKRMLCVRVCKECLVIALLVPTLLYFSKQNV